MHLCSVACEILLSVILLEAERDHAYDISNQRTSEMTCRKHDLFQLQAV